MFKNWKPKLAALASLAFQFAEPILSGQAPHVTLHDIPGLIVTLGLFFVKQHNVTGGTVVQPSTTPVGL